MSVGQDRAGWIHTTPPQEGGVSVGVGRKKKYIIIPNQGDISVGKVGETSSDWFQSTVLAKDPFFYPFGPPSSNHSSGMASR